MCLFGLPVEFIKQLFGLADPECHVLMEDCSGLQQFDQVLPAHRMSMCNTAPSPMQARVADSEEPRRDDSQTGTELVGSVVRREPVAPLAHRRPGYPLSSCTSAELDSVSPGNYCTITSENSSCQQ
ncbi:hypothetical protein Poly41_57410 [Novipirellula artificiosorum]|uniref:Uncharacterized protein n=1 Tax=Novipirellula artificiosorum TaxID=2528016 RepID=A0A5C6DAJ3_9BACT|nr:hypothetical protein Poly41_57410 [Novipirellula artificiosorum]